MKFVGIIGEREEKEEKIAIKNLETKVQVEVGLQDKQRITEVFGKP